jgi:hypothetical protein
MPEKYHAHGLELYELAHTVPDPDLRRAYLKAASSLFVAARDVGALPSVAAEETALRRLFGRLSLRRQARFR